MTKIISLPHDFIHDTTIPNKVKKFICCLHFHEPNKSFSSTEKKVWERLRLTYNQFFKANKWCQQNNYSHFIGKGPNKEREYTFSFVPLARSPLFLLFFSDLFTLPFEAQTLFAHIFKLCYEENDYKIAYTNKYFEAIFTTTRRPIEYYFSLLFKEKLIVKLPESQKMSVRRETETPKVYEKVFVEHRIITLSPYYLDLRKEKYSHFYIQSLTPDPHNKEEKNKNPLPLSQKITEIYNSPFAQWSVKCSEFIDKALPVYEELFPEKEKSPYTRVLFLFPILEEYFKDHNTIPSLVKTFKNSLTLEEMHRLSPKRLEGKIFDMLAEVEIDENKLFSRPFSLRRTLILPLKWAASCVRKIYETLQKKVQPFTSGVLTKGLHKIREKIREYILKRYPHLRKDYKIRDHYLETAMVFGVFYTLFSISDSLRDQLINILNKTFIPKESPLPLQGERLAHFYLSRIFAHFQTSLTLPMIRFLIEGDFTLFPKYDDDMLISPLLLCIYNSCRFLKNKVYREIDYQRRVRSLMWRELSARSSEKRYFYNVKDPAPYLMEYSKNPHSSEELGKKIYFRGCHPLWKTEQLEYPDIYVQEDLSELENSFPHNAGDEVKDQVKNLYLTEKIGMLYNLSHWAKTTYTSLLTRKEFIHRELYIKRREAFYQAAVSQPQKFSFSKENEMLYTTLTHASIVSLEDNEWWKEVFNL